MNDYWNYAQRSTTVALVQNTNTDDNLKKVKVRRYDSTNIAYSDTDWLATLVYDTTNNKVLLTSNGTTSGVKYAEIGVNGGSSTHNPTFTVANVTGADTQSHSFNITPSCSGTDGTSVAYTMAITAYFTSTVTSISAKTTNFSRNDRVTLLQGKNIVRNVYFNLSSYWDAAYNAGVASSSTHNMSISLSKDSGGGSNSKYVRFAIDGSCNGSSAEPKYLFANIAESSSSNLTANTYSKDNVVQFSTSNSSSGAGSIISSSYIPLSRYWATALTAGENSVKVSSFSISTNTTHKQYTVTASLSNGTSSKFSIYHENERYNIATYYNEKNVISGYINNTENIIFDFATMWRVYDSVFTAYRTTSSTLRTRLQYTSTAKDQLLIKYSEECGILIGVDNTTHKLNVAIVGHSGTDLTNMTLVNDKIYTVQSTSATPTWVWGSDENALRI